MPTKILKGYRYDSRVELLQSTRELMEALYTRLFRIGKLNRYRVAELVGLVGTVSLAELLIYNGLIQGALGVYLLMFVAVLILPYVAPEKGEVAMAFSLIPLFRLINFGMPVFFESTLGWIALIYGSLIIATVLTAAALPAAHLRTAGGIGQLFIHLPYVAGAAIVLGTIEDSVLTPGPLITALSVSEGVFFVVLMIGFIGLGEELLFRGVIQSTVADYAGPGPALIVSTLLFVVLNSALFTPEVIVWAAFTGGILGVYYELTNNWVITGMIRGVANILVYESFTPVHPLWESLPVLLG